MRWKKRVEDVGAREVVFENVWIHVCAVGLACRREEQPAQQAGAAGGSEGRASAPGQSRGAGEEKE
jgi:hypothetical protein